MPRVYNRNAGHADRKPNWWLDYSAGDVRVRERACGGDKRASERLLATRVREVASGTWKPPSGRNSERQTLAEYAERWIATREAEGVRSASDEASRLRDHVLPVLGHRPLKEIGRPEVKTMIANLVATRALAPRTIHHVYGSLRSLYSRAVEDEVVVASPCSLRVRQGELPKKADKDPKWRALAVFNASEVETLISDPRLPWNRRTFYALLFFSGARFGEIAGRRWCDWDRAMRPLTRITIATQYDDQALKSPDGAGPTRELPVHPVLERILRDWWDTGFALTYCRAPQPNDWIVPSMRDGRSLRSLRNGLKRLHEDCERLGLRTRRQHDTRRTFLSLLRSAGVPKDMARAFTHSGLGDVLDSYTEWTWPALCDALSKMPVGFVGPTAELAHFKAHSGLGAADPPVFQGDQWRGGRDSNPRPPA